MEASGTEALTRIADAAARRHVGIALGVLDARSGERTVACRGTSRHPDGPPVHAATLFEIGSVTKTFTGLLLADAVVRGDVDLDTRLQDVVPAGVRVPSSGGVDISLEHLATHRSGLPTWPSGWRPVLRAGFAAHEELYADLTVAGLLEAVERARLRRTPGTGRPRYSNFGMAVLGQALVHHLGRPDYATLVRERVCEPLGLHDTVVVPDAEQAGRKARGHGRRNRLIEPWSVLGLAGAGALRSTAHDLLTFVGGHLRPEKTPLADALALTQQERHSSRLGGRGLAWMRAPGSSGPLFLHGGATGFRSLVAFAPGAGVGMVALGNSVRGPDRAAIGFLRALERTSATGSDPRARRTAARSSRLHWRAS